MSTKKPLYLLGCSVQYFPPILSLYCPCKAAKVPKGSQDPKGAKNGGKLVFPKVALDLLACLNKLFWALLSSFCPFAVKPQIW